MKRVDRVTRGRIRKIIENAFPGANTLADFDLALSDNLADERWTNGSIHHSVPQGSNVSVQLQHVLDLANARGWLPDLIAALRESQPTNADFQSLLAGITATVPASAPAAVLQQVLPGGAMNQFQTLERRMRTVCRIDYADRSPPGAGTGFLVGPDLVLTNHHVARRAIESPAAQAQLRFRFDLRSATAAADGTGRSCGATLDGGDAVLRCSPPGGVEVRAAGEPSLAELDYALIRLAETPAGDDMGAGETRGFSAITPGMPAPAANGSIIALQHPMRGELQFAIGSIQGPNEPGSRVRHTAATLEGSSGSPILDAALAPVMLHNGTRPESVAEGQPYNTGVPLKLIAADLAQHGLA